MVSEILASALEAYRQPPPVKTHFDPESPLPLGLDTLVGDLGATLSRSHIGETAATLGSTPEELRSAVQFLIRQLLLDPAASRYRVLGVDRNSDPQRIARHYHALVWLFHPDRLPAAERAQGAQDMARINAAYGVLRDPESRHRYDLELTSTDRPRRWIRRHAGRQGQGRPAGRYTWGLLRLAALGIAGFVATAILAWSALSIRPGLRVTADTSRVGESRPTFLSSLPRRAEAAVREGPSRPDTPADPRHSPRPGGQGPVPGASPRLSGGGAESPELLLVHLERHLREGNLPALLGLLTEDVRITKADRPVHSGGGDLFQGTLDRALRLADVGLTRVDAQRMQAKGRLDLAPGSRVGALPQGTGSAGEIRLEIVRQGDAYRICALDYRIGGPVPQ